MLAYYQFEHKIYQRRLINLKKFIRKNELNFLFNIDPCLNLASILDYQDLTLAQLSR